MAPGTYSLRHWEFLQLQGFLGLLVVTPDCVDPAPLGSFAGGKGSWGSRGREGARVGGTPAVLAGGTATGAITLCGAAGRD